MEDIERVQAWATAKKLDENTADELIKNGFNSIESLSLLTLDDIKTFKIPLGQEKMLMRAVEKTFVKETEANGATNMAANDAEPQSDIRAGSSLTGNQSTGPRDGDEDPYIRALMDQLKTNQLSATGSTETLQNITQKGIQGTRDLKALDDLVLHFRGNTFAASTKKTYMTYLKSYVQFCKMFAIPLFPLSNENAARYIAYLSRKLQYNSISNYLIIIKLIHVEAGLPDPLAGHFVHSVLQGAKRVLGTVSNRKLPITPSILRRIFTTINLSCTRDLAFWAACLVAFFSFLRKSNLLIPSPSQFDPKVHLSRQDIIFQPKGVVLRIRKTKSIQYAQKVLEIPLPRIQDSPFCPAGALLLLHNMVPNNTTSCPAFIYLHKHLVTPLTYPTFLARLKHALHLLGIDSNKYSGHSFRRGGASFALECGLPGEVIQAQGDWRSDAYKSYLDPSLSYRHQVMHAFATAFTSSSFK